MSKSGVPVVSQAAEATNTIVNAFGDVVSGKNVFESVGRALVAPVSANVDLINDITFHKLEGAPLEVGNLLKSGSDFSENPYDKDLAFQFTKSGAIVGGSVLGAAFGAPALEGIGITGTAATVTSGLASNKILSGGNVLESLAPIAGGLAGDLGLNDYVGNVQDIFGSIGSAGVGQASYSQAPRQYTNNVMGAPNLGGGNNNFAIFIVLGLLATYFFMRKT